jgi:Zn-dependent membrane protease YugP
MVFRRKWTAHEADEWTKEDYWAVVFSSLSYLLVTIGSALCFLLPVWGLLLTGAGLVCAGVMYWIIDPKLRTISLEYEARQKEYLKELDRIMSWEER